MNAPAPAPGSTPPKPRNSVERVVVWGGIVLLLVVVIIEFRAKAGYAASLNALNSLVAEDTADVTFEQAAAVMQMAPTKAAPQEAPEGTYHKYSWFSLFKPGMYEITLRVKEQQTAGVQDKDEAGNPVVLLLDFTTAQPPAEPEPVIEELPADSGTAPSEGSDGSGGYGGGGGGGYGGGGGRGDGGRGDGGGRGQRPETETPEGEAPATEAPATEAPAAESPAAETSATEAPAAESPATETPAAESPATETPAAEAN